MVLVPTLTSKELYSVQMYKSPHWSIKMCKETVSSILKEGRTIKDLLVAPKDKDYITKKSGIIPRFQCDRVECYEEYIVEFSGTFGEKFKEHLKAFCQYMTILTPQVILENFSIHSEKGGQNLMRLIKEAIYIKINNASLNRNMGKYHLPHIWMVIKYDITIDPLPTPSATRQ